jgi:peptide/nickel transport system permease protein
VVGFLLRRVGSTIVTVVIATFLVFLVNEYSAGNVGRKILGPFSTFEQQDILNKELRLDDPVVVRYVRWAGVVLGIIPDPLADSKGMMKFHDPRGPQYFGNLGLSTLYQKSVNDVLWPRLASTAMLAGFAFALMVPLAILLGLWMGLKAGRPIDHVLSTASVVTASTPEFAAGIFMSVIFSVWLGWLPGVSPLTAGGEWNWLQQMILPAGVLVLIDVGYVARIVRTSVAEVNRSDFVRTAVLKGLPRRVIIFRHILPNAMIAPLTVILLQINWLIAGVVVVETIFAYPGFGRMLLEAALYGDVAIIEAAAIVTLLLAITTQILSDLGYRYLNPKIRGA